MCTYAHDTDIVTNTDADAHVQGDRDEEMLEKFNSLDAVLSDRSATIAYKRYLHSHQPFAEKYLLFWIDLKVYLAEYHLSSVAAQQESARELQRKYFDSGARYELAAVSSSIASAINSNANPISKQKSIDGFLKPQLIASIRHKIETNMVTREMFAEVQQTIYHFLLANINQFFESDEFFRFIVTFNQYGGGGSNSSRNTSRRGSRSAIKPLRRHTTATQQQQQYRNRANAKSIEQLIADAEAASVAGPSASTSPLMPSTAAFASAATTASPSPSASASVSFAPPSAAVLLSSTAGSRSVGGSGGGAGLSSSSSMLVHSATERHMMNAMSSAANATAIMMMGEVVEEEQKNNADGSGGGVGVTTNTTEAKETEDDENHLMWPANFQQMIAAQQSKNSYRHHNSEQNLKSLQTIRYQMEEQRKRKRTNLRQQSVASASLSSSFGSGVGSNASSVNSLKRRSIKDAIAAANEDMKTFFFVCL